MVYTAFYLCLGWWWVVMYGKSFSCKIHLQLRLFWVKLGFCQLVTWNYSRWLVGLVVIQWDLNQPATTNFLEGFSHRRGLGLDVGFSKVFDPKPPTTHNPISQEVDSEILSLSLFKLNTFDLSLVPCVSFLGGLNSVCQYRTVGSIG